MAEWKERILKEYAETKNLPRKAKKKKRKCLELDWHIASYEPFKIPEKPKINCRNLIRKNGHNPIIH